MVVVSVLAIRVTCQVLDIPLKILRAEIYQEKSRDGFVQDCGISSVLALEC